MIGRLLLAGASSRVCTGDPFHLVPHVVCSNGRQYSIFKHNTIRSSLESAVIWGHLPGTEVRKQLLLIQGNTNGVSTMVDICVPQKLERLRLQLRSSNGSLWSLGSYLTVFDFTTHTPLLTTSLTEPKEQTLLFPGLRFPFSSCVDGVATIPLSVTVNVPSMNDRFLISIWCEYSNITTMVGLLYNPFPYYQYLIRTIHVPATASERYTVHFHNLYDVSLPANVLCSIQVRDRLVGQFRFVDPLVAEFSLSTALFCPEQTFHDITFPATHIDAIAEVVCNDGTVGYRRRCDSWGIWKDPEGPGCVCPREEDDFGRVWESVRGGSLQSQSCRLGERGTVQRTCDLLGKWRPPRTQCVRRACGDTWFHGIFLRTAPVNSTVEMSCSSGEGTFSFFCSDQERWFFLESRCHCEAVEDPWHWPTLAANNSHSLPCERGFTGSLVRRCGVNGKWEPVVRNCAPLTCPVLRDRFLTFPETLINHAATVECPPPFTGTVTRFCSETQSWSRSLDHCERPQCDGFFVRRVRRDCLSVDRADRRKDELIRVVLLPTPIGVPPTFNTTLPGTICGLETNVPYEIWLERFAEGAKQTCVLESMYGSQQCERMLAPILRERTEENGVLSLRVMIQVPFCFDQTLQSIQIRIECVKGCEEKPPRILTHLCKEQDSCPTDKLILISSFQGLVSSNSYHLSARAVPVASPSSSPSLWSPPLLLQPSSPSLQLQPRLALIPKSSHSVQLTWSFPGVPVPFLNHIVHVFVSSIGDRTLDPRYLTYIDSQSVCSGTQLCSRRSLILPVTELGLRYVYILESLPAPSLDIVCKNGTIEYLVPMEPYVRSIVTNFDTFVNVTFLDANMDVVLNCALIDARSQELTRFTLFIDYKEIVSQIIGDLQPQAAYSLQCSVRDGFKNTRKFDLSLRPVAFTPIVVSINITQTFFTHVEVTLSANKQGSFYCMAINAHTPIELSRLSPSMLDEMGHRREYNVPFIPVNMLIPFNPMYGEEGRLDTKVFVVCDFVTTSGISLSSSQLLKAQASAPKGRCNEGR